MSRERIDLGRRAEDLALEYLQSIGYRLQARNYRFRGGELDLVMCDGPVLVFVEVRSRTSQQHGTPLEAIDPKAPPDRKNRRPFPRPRKNQPRHPLPLRRHRRRLRHRRTPCRARKKRLPLRRITRLNPCLIISKR